VELEDRMNTNQIGKARVFRIAVAAVVSFALVFASVPAGAAIEQVAGGSDSVAGKTIGAAIGSMTDSASVFAGDKKVRIKFHANKGKINKKSKKVTVGKAYGKLPTPERAGYYFKGWYTKKSGGKKITKSSIVKYTKTKTLYAHWRKAVLSQKDAMRAVCRYEEWSYPVKGMVCDGPYKDGLGTFKYGTVYYTVQTRSSGGGGFPAGALLATWHVNKKGIVHPR
jgi:uncharacterized repeat protein (TIGR02543 family)